MSNDTNILGKILNEMLKVVQPLVTANQGGTQNLIQIASQLGFQVSPGDANKISVAITTISGDVNTLTTIGSDPTKLLSLLQGIRDLLTSIQNLEQVNAAKLSGFGNALIDYLIVTYLENYRQPIYGILLLLGIIEDYSFNWNKIPKVFQLGSLLQSEYQWNTGSFDAAKMLKALQVAGRGIGIPVDFRLDAPGATSAYLFLGFDAGDIQLGARIQYAADPASSSNDGLAVVPAASATINKTIDLGGGWSLIANVTLSGQIDYGIIIRPSGINLGPIPPKQTFTGKIDGSVGISKTNPSGGNIILFGKSDSTRLQATSFTATLGLHPSQQEVSLEIDFNGLQLIIDTSNVDSFLNSVLGSGKQEIDLNSSLIWSSKSGFHFKGSGGMEVIVPVRQSFGIIDINSITLTLKISDTSLDFLVGASGGLELGPLEVVVDNVGLKISLGQVAQGQQAVFGNFDLTFGTKSPDGLGVSIDCGVIVGGGYLAYDENSGRYSGAIELQISGIAVQAFGILDTKSPSGNSDYSFVVVITAQFPPPGIQLGFGLNLSGIGGIAGVNRTIASDVLEQDVKAGTLNNILFPQDLVKNAPQIISDLGSVFPAQDNHYVFGPIVMLNYGTGSIIIAEIGLVIELDPNVDKLVILGVLSSTLPTKDTQIIGINLDVDGIIDFPNKSLSVDASIYNSHVANFPLAGDMAVRACFGDNPTFLFSIGGGFNPALADIPPGFPKLQPARVSLGQSDNPRIDFTGHLAIGSNVFDIGASVSLYAQAGGFYLNACAGFSVMIHFHPFNFHADISAGVQIGKDGKVLLSASLSASLDGPNPWHAKGNVSFTILLIDISVGFDATFGSTTQESASSDDPLGHLSSALIKALGEPKNWSGILPTAESTHVSLKPQRTEPDAMLVDPWGSITVRQTAVPLDTNINVYDNAPFSPPANFSITQVTLENGPVLAAADVQTVQDNFAAANFEQMTDDQKLSRRSFDLMDSGIAIKPEETLTQDDISTPITYDTKFMYAKNQSKIIRANYNIRPEVLLAVSNFSAKSKSFVANSGFGKFAYHTDSKIILAPDSYAVVSSQDLTVRQDIMSTRKSLTQTQAYQTMNRYVSNHPDEKGTVQVVPVVVANKK